MTVIVLEIKKLIIESDNYSSYSIRDIDSLSDRQ